MKRYVTIDIQVAINNNISLSDWAFLENISFLQNNETGYCYAKRNKLAEYIGITTRGLRLLITRLSKDGYLKENKKGHLKTTKKWFDLQNLEGELSSYLEGNSVPHEGELSSYSTYKKKENISPFSFSLNKKSKYDNLSDEYKSNLKEYARVKDNNKEFESFIDYHTSKGSLFNSWASAYNTWCRNAEKFNPTQNTNSDIGGYKF